jgi:hydrogenase maturation protein HypF
LGLSCDGTGYGPDGAIWGGELLLCRYESFERLGHLDYLPLPGGAAAIKEPWRMAVSYLEAAFGTAAAGLDLAMLERQDPDRLNLLRQIVAKGVSSPPTSSLGRLFDGVAALVGLRDRAAFEGQAAMMLEMQCPGLDFPPYRFEIAEIGGEFILDYRPIIRGIVNSLRAGCFIPEISSRFHRTVIDALTAWTVKAAAVTGVRTAVLSGGCFQNLVLTEGLMRELVGAGFDVYTQNSVPVNDGGLSLGQAVVAGARLSQGKEALV